jgi:hypothetical protein
LTEKSKAWRKECAEYIIGKKRMTIKNKSSLNEDDKHFELIYENKLLRIEEINFYPGNLKITLRNQEDEVIHSFMSYILGLLKTVLPFEETYMIVTKGPSETGIVLYPWTEALVERFKHPSNYVYPFNTASFTESLREVFRGSFKEDCCEKLIDKTESNPFETLLSNEHLRALENTETAKELKAHGFAFEDILKKQVVPISSTHYFISNKRKKTGKETLNDIMEIFSLFCDIKSKSAEKRSKKGYLSIVK